MKKNNLRTWMTLLVTLFVIFISGLVWAANEKININTADIQQLAQLKRIGPSYAARIIEYREQNGAFQQPEDIMKVKGIGSKTFEENKEIIIVTEEEVEKTE